MTVPKQSLVMRGTMRHSCDASETSRRFGGREIIY
jgi:hypothetical protein